LQEIKNEVVSIILMIKMYFFIKRRSYKNIIKEEESDSKVFRIQGFALTFEALSSLYLLPRENYAS